MALEDFFSRDAGQRRRKWLNSKAEGALDALRYYGGPGAATPLLAVEGAAMLNPVNDALESMEAAGDGRYLDSAVNAAAVVAPVAAGKVAKAYNPRMADDAAQWLEDALMGVSVNPTAATARATAGNFVGDESGALASMMPSQAQLSPAQAEAQNILDLLAEGRGAEVTDEMMSAADDAYLFDNYDLPMDEASRMERAAEMGFDTETRLFHGGVRDFDNIIPSARGKIGPGVYLTPSERKANIFAGYEYGPTEKLERAFNEGNEKSSQVYSLLTTNNPAPMEARMAARAERSAYDDTIDAYFNAFKDGGYDGVSVEDERTILDPSNIRSRFARFDPRLAHLRNLSAGVGGAGLVSMYPTEQEQIEAEMRAYLGL